MASRRELDYRPDLRAWLSPSDIIIINDGPKLITTNYWQTEHCARGFYYLTANAGCTRLLMPPSRLQDLKEMTAGGVREVILTRGPWETQVRGIEVMFEDESTAPYCLHLDEKQLDRHWAPKDEGKRWRFAIYTQATETACKLLAELAPCFLRSAPRLPYLQPWTGGRP